MKDLSDTTGQTFSMADLHRATGLSVSYLTALLGEKRGVSAKGALRLATFFGDDPMAWLEAQARWELQEAKSELATTRPTRQDRAMRLISSKYDEFWTAKFDENGGIEALLQKLRDEGCVILACPDIRNFGNRQNWSGQSVISAEGKIGGDIMAHTAALKNLLPAHLNPVEVVSCRMSASCQAVFTLNALDGDAGPPKHRLPRARKDAGACATLSSPAELWNQALTSPVPLFLTQPGNLLAVVFDDRGFFLSPEAQTKYDALKSLPHIYVLRFASDDAFYIGRSNQPGGRLKRSHAYHLGGLAHELLGTTRYDDQRSHRFWVKTWFKVPERDHAKGIRKERGYYVVDVRESVVVSFLQQSQNDLHNVERILISEARRRGKVVLNRTS